MITRKLFFLISLCLIVSSVQSQEIMLSDLWRFSTGDNKTWATPDFDDTQWAQISAAKTWEEQGYLDYDGFAWYRNSFVLSPAMRSQVRKYGGLIVRYDNADDVDEFYFNGKLVGTTGTMPPNYVSRYGQKRKYLVPLEHIQLSKPNHIAVRVYDGTGGGGLLTAKTTIRPLSVTDAVTHVYSIPAKDWVFMGDEPQRVLLNMQNTLKEKVRFNAVLVVKTDKYRSIDSIVLPVEIGAGKMMTTALPLNMDEPGFFRCWLYFEKDGVKGDVEQFNVGFEPEKINSPRDARPDFEEFWKQSLADLALVNPDFKMTLLPERSSATKNVYHVKMMSYMNVMIEGYYAVPKVAGKYPAIARYMGYGSDGFYPDPDSRPGFAEFILSVRGQGIQKPKSAYGKWDIWGLSSKETYYYRGAFLDLVRAIDFLVSRPEVDPTKIVAEGGSQGGAFTLAVCALDHRIRAAAPTIPFLSDYRDYFSIVPWPRVDFEEYLQLNPDSNWEKVYQVLSYFDIKNLAGWIQCPVLMAAGLQDEVCPPHTNFAGYNQIKSEKAYRIYHEWGHGTPPEWEVLKMNFYKEKLGLK